MPPSRGPSADITHVEALMVQAWQRIAIHTALLDAGYDSERTHCLLRYDFGIRSIIPPKIGRPTSRAPTGHFRAQMKRHFPKKTYGQRWQAETGISMIKRRQGECLQAVTGQAQNRAMALKVITHNILILRDHHRGFLQSIPVPFSHPSYPHNQWNRRIST